jgi:hypothetical protein
MCSHFINCHNHNFHSRVVSGTGPSPESRLHSAAMFLYYFEASLRHMVLSVNVGTLTRSRSTSSSDPSVTCQGRV